MVNLWGKFFRKKIDIQKIGQLFDPRNSFDMDEEGPTLKGKFYEGEEEIEIDLSKVVYPGNSYAWVPFRRIHVAEMTERQKFDLNILKTQNFFDTNLRHVLVFKTLRFFMANVFARKSTFFLILI